MWPLVPAILLCKRGGNVTVGPTVERLANQSNVWGKSIREGSAGWADPFSFPQPSTVPARPLVLFLTVRPPSGLVWQWQLAVRLSGLSGPPTNENTLVHCLSHCQTASHLVVFVLSSPTNSDISSAAHHGSERPPSIRLPTPSLPHLVRAGTSLRHTQSTSSSQTGLRLRGHPASLPAANSPSSPRPVPCPRSIVHRHFGVKVPLLSIMGHLLDAKWSFVESAERVCHLA